MDRPTIEQPPLGEGSAAALQILVNLDGVVIPPLMTVEEPSSRRLPPE